MASPESYAAHIPDCTLQVIDMPVPPYDIFEDYELRIRIENPRDVLPYPRTQNGRLMEILRNLLQNLEDLPRLVR